MTVHDLAFLRDESHFTPRGVRFFKRALARTRDEAAVVIVPSRATAADCVAAGIDQSRIAVVPHGVRVIRPTPEEVARFRRAHGLHRPYVLWTGTREPRKNLSGLISAFKLVASETPGVDLVLVGPAGWGNEAVAPPALSDRVHHLGRLTWPDLQLAYGGARAFCFPSLWEGFGLPVLEAMAHGVPVVTSDGTATAEVADGAALLVDPSDPNTLAAAMAQAIGPDHDRLSTAGLAVAERATWRSAAEGTVRAYRAAVVAHAERSG